jgi:glutamyl/glutaminyl-tRNA synthetase
MVITRFNPSANGNLHLGHLFTLLVNDYFVSSRNGELIIRFDDTSPVAVNTGDRLESIITSQIDDIRWLGIAGRVSGWQRQSHFREILDIKLYELGFDNIEEIADGEHYLPPVIKNSFDWVAYPYMPQQTAERVIMDNIMGVTHLIRGDDFLTEYSLYRYYCQLFEYPAPEFIFLPRLCSANGDISKTKGGHKIADFRANGYTPEQVIRILEKACLYYPNNGWEFYNIRPNPRVDL